MCELHIILFIMTFHIRKSRRDGKMEASVAAVGLWSELFAGYLCGLLAQGWVNLWGESWDFAESSVPFLISVVVARVFMFTGQLNICPPPSFLLQAKRSQTLVLSWVRVVPFQFHVSATMWERDVVNCPVLGKVYIIQPKIKHWCYTIFPLVLTKVTSYDKQPHKMPKCFICKHCSSLKAAPKSAYGMMLFLKQTCLYRSRLAYSQSTYPKGLLHPKHKISSDTNRVSHTWTFCLEASPPLPARVYVSSPITRLSDTDRRWARMSFSFILNMRVEHSCPVSPI